MRIYEVELKEKEIIIQDQSKGESLSMSRPGFRKFLEWMHEETRLIEKEKTESQVVDVWDYIEP
jgi:hypothetical protein